MTDPCEICEPIQNPICAVECQRVCPFTELGGNKVPFDINKPLMAEIYDFDTVAFDDDTKSITRKVDQIEFPCKRHDNTVIWYSDGFQSRSFKLLPQD